MIMEAHNEKEKSINLRNSFWSPDYITGIETFLALVKQDNEKLHQEIIFYETVTLDCFAPLSKSLETTCQGNKPKAQRPLGDDILSKYLLNIKQCGMLDLTETCVLPLDKCLKENKLFYDEIEEELHAHYESYQRAWKLAKESYMECQNLTNSIVNNLTKMRQANQPIELVENVTQEEQDKTSSLAEPLNSTLFEELKFPFKLDETFLFNNETELTDFLNLLKSKLRVQKPTISILGTSKEYFDGQSLISTLKKIDPKLDTSMFNLSRISQSLLTEGIIQEYKNVGGSYFNNFKLNNNDGKIFQLESYYIWDSSVFDKKSSTLVNKKPKKSYGELAGNSNNQVKDSTAENNRNVSGSLSTWFRKVSGAEFNSSSNIATMGEINEKIVRLNSWQDRYFERYQGFIYSRVQLEKTLFIHCNKYEKFASRTRHLMKSVVRNFQSKISTMMNLKTNPTVDSECSQISRTNHLPIGFFSRDNAFPFTKWVIHKDDAKFIAYETLFSCTIINKDILNTIECIISFIETQINDKSITSQQCLEYWKSNIDLSRASDLEREFIKEFKDMTNNSEINNNVIKTIIKRSGNESKFINDSWIDLLKLFQLELPDSLIPTTLHDEILKSKNFSWLKLIPLDKLKLINLIATHLNKLGDIETLFFNNGDIPFLQYFIRVRGLGLSLGENAATLSNILLNLFKYHLDEIATVIINKTLEIERGENIPTIQIDKDNVSADDGSLLQPAKITLNTGKTPGHSRSISMTLLTSGLKNLGNDGSKKEEDDEDFVPLPFKTSSTPGSPNNLLDSQKRKSGINLLTPSNDDLN